MKRLQRASKKAQTTIAGARLCDGCIAIRPYRRSDARAVYDAIHESAGEVSRWLPDMSAELSLADVTGYISVQQKAWGKDIAYSFVIVDQRTKGIIGGCGITQINRRHNFANMYYWVRSSRTRHGIATHAIRLLARFGIESVRLQRVEIVAALENRASLRVAEKAGAKREGTLRKRITVGNTVHDAAMFSLVAEDLGL